MTGHKHNEDNESIALMRWASLIFIGSDSDRRLSDYLIHIPNGGKRNAREAARLKRMGVKAGVSDYFLAYPSRDGAPGLWVELKIPGGRVTPDQDVWQVRMHSVGFAVVVSYGWTEARDAILRYLGKSGA